MTWQKERRKSLIKIIGLGIISSGCVAPLRDTKEYSLNLPLKIILQEQKNLTEEYREKYHKDARGWADLRERKVVVPYSDEKDKFGNYLPDFEVLGKEVWHMEELGGHYHD